LKSVEAKTTAPDFPDRPLVAAMFPVTRTDVRGRTITVSEAPERIVSLVPSQTELLADLGLHQAVVGITRFCERPDHWREEKTVVGGTKQVQQDVVRDLRPDLIIANREENERSDVQALDEVAPTYVTDVTSVPDALDMIRTVGSLTDRDRRAGALADRIARRFDELPDFQTLSAVYLIWREPFMTVGGDTFIHDLMGHGGFENLYGAETRYPHITLDDLADADPDVVLCASEPFPFHQKERFTTDIREAAGDATVRVVDGQVFSWYGSRLLDAPAALTNLRERLADLQVTP
jgi:ABC-type Fe3+-hydroxamate transport system substrate-binding protein